MANASQMWSIAQRGANFATGDAARWAGVDAAPVQDMRSHFGGLGKTVDSVTGSMRRFRDEVAKVGNAQKMAAQYSSDVEKAETRLIAVQRRLADGTAKTRQELERLNSEQAELNRQLSANRALLGDQNKVIRESSTYVNQYVKATSSAIARNTALGAAVAISAKVMGTLRDRSAMAAEALLDYASSMNTANASNSKALAYAKNLTGSYGKMEAALKNMGYSAEDAAKMYSSMRNAMMLSGDGMLAASAGAQDYAKRLGALSRVLGVDYNETLGEVMKRQDQFGTRVGDSVGDFKQLYQTINMVNLGYGKAMIDQRAMTRSILELSAATQGYGMNMRRVQDTMIALVSTSKEFGATNKQAYGAAQFLTGATMGHNVQTFVAHNVGQKMWGDIHDALSGKSGKEYEDALGALSGKYGEGLDPSEQSRLKTRIGALYQYQSKHGAGRWSYGGGQAAFHMLKHTNSGMTGVLQQMRNVGGLTSESLAVLSHVFGIPPDIAFDAALLMDTDQKAALKNIAAARKKAEKDGHLATDRSIQNAAEYGGTAQRGAVGQFAAKAMNNFSAGAEGVLGNLWNTLGPVGAIGLGTLSTAGGAALLGLGARSRMGTWALGHILGMGGKGGAAIRAAMAGAGTAGAAGAAGAGAGVAEAGAGLARTVTYTSELMPGYVAGGGAEGAAGATQATALAANKAGFLSRAMGVLRKVGRVGMVAGGALQSAHMLYGGVTGAIRGASEVESRGIVGGGGFIGGASEGALGFLDPSGQIAKGLGGGAYSNVAGADAALDAIDAEIRKVKNAKRIIESSGLDETAQKKALEEKDKLMASLKGQRANIKNMMDVQSRSGRSIHKGGVNVAMELRRRLDAGEISTEDAVKLLSQDVGEDKARAFVSGRASGDMLKDIHGDIGTESKTGVAMFGSIRKDQTAEALQRQAIRAALAMGGTHMLPQAINAMRSEGQTDAQWDVFKKNAFGDISGDLIKSVIAESGMNEQTKDQRAFLGDMKSFFTVDFKKAVTDAISQPLQTIADSQMAMTTASLLASSSPEVKNIIGKMTGGAEGLANSLSQRIGYVTTPGGTSQLVTLNRVGGSESTNSK